MEEMERFMSKNGWIKAEEEEDISFYKLDTHLVKLLIQVKLHLLYY